MNDMHFILFTTEEGGIFKAIRGTREQYDEAVEAGILRIPLPWKGDGSHEEAWIKFIAFGKIEDNYDVILGRTRG